MIIEPIDRYYAIALELGKASEGSAVALVELEGSPGPAVIPREKARFAVRGLQRFTPGTEYRQITDSLRKLLGSGPVAEELEQKHVRLPDGSVRSARTQLSFRQAWPRHVLTHGQTRQTQRSGEHSVP